MTSYAAWAAKNKPPLACPIATLQRKWGCARNYPQRMHTKFLLLGSVKNRFQGRPQTEWSDELIARIEELIREARDKQCIATPHEIARALMKEFCGAPGRETVRKKKKELGFVPHNVKKKPLLDKEMMRERLRFGKKYARWSLARTLVVDEKQFEEGDNLGRYELCLAKCDSRVSKLRPIRRGTRSCTWLVPPSTRRSPSLPWTAIWSSTKSSMQNF